VKLNEIQLQKADPVLREALKQAKGDERLRAVMVLASGEGKSPDGTDESIRPGQFPSRSGYRKALIAQREQQLMADLGATMSALEALSLNVRGGKTSPTVVVEGLAREILSSLELPGVRHASLDQPLELIAPRRDQQSDP
jgi:hypothetical protein